MAQATAVRRDSARQRQARWPHSGSRCVPVPASSLPAVVVLLAITIFPLLYTLRLTVLSWELTTSFPATFVGLENFAQILFQRRRFWNAMKVTSILVVGGVGPEVCPGHRPGAAAQPAERIRSVAGFPVPDPGHDRAGGGGLSVPA